MRARRANLWADFFCTKEKKMKSAMAASFIGLFIGMSSCMAFADEVDTNGAAQLTAESEPTIAPAEAQPVEQPVVAQPVAEPVVAQPVVDQQVMSASNYDWEKDSLIYKRVGWGLFGGGLLLGGVVGGAMLGSAIHENKKLDGEGVEGIGHGIGNAMLGYAGIGIIAVGGAVMLSGIGVLIAEAVKFNPYRSGEIAGNKFEWNPEFYVSPEFSGVGFSARF